MSSTPQRPSANAPDDPISARDSTLDWNALEDVMHRDDGARGLAGFRVEGVPLDRGQLRAAALDLARRAQSVGIATGFCAVLPDRVTAETDGPPGALFLAQVLRTLGIEVTLIADRYAMPLLERGCDLLNFDRAMLAEFPFDDGEADRWIDTFLTRGRGQGMSHLIAIERPGPSHTLESVVSQTRRGAAPAKRFQSEVPDRHRNVCHNMHGAPIGVHTADIHRLFEAAHQQKPPITTIGIGDGGNEIGMGRFAWEDLTEAVGGGAASRITCRIVTDFTLISGVSNWGAYALALATGWLRRANLSNRWIEPAGQRALIETLVARAGAVDGRTLRPEPTVDGLPLDEYLNPLAAMHAILARA